MSWCGAWSDWRWLKQCSLAIESWGGRAFFQESWITPSFNPCPDPFLQPSLSPVSFQLHWFSRRAGSPFLCLGPYISSAGPIGTVSLVGKTVQDRASGTTRSSKWSRCPALFYSATAMTSTTPLRLVWTGTSSTFLEGPIWSQKSENKTVIFLFVCLFVRFVWQRSKVHVNTIQPVNMCILKSSGWRKSKKKKELLSWFIICFPVLLWVL